MSHGSIPLPGPSAELGFHFTSLPPTSNGHRPPTENVQLSENSRKCYSSHGGLRNAYRDYCCRAPGAALLDGPERRHVQAMLLLLPSSISNFTSLGLTALVHFISFLLTTSISCMSARLLDSPLTKQSSAQTILARRAFQQCSSPTPLTFRSSQFALPTSDISLW